MIAANIDTAFIVQSCHFDFNPRRLDRYLIMAADGHVEPIVILTKTDLIPRNELEQKVAIVSSVANARVLASATSAVSGLTSFSRHSARKDLLPARVIRCRQNDLDQSPLGPGCS